MHNAIYAFLAAAVLAALLPTADAHMSMWHPSMYGFDETYEPVTPLANKPFNQWWFHGYANKVPSQVMTINPGKTINIELACSKSYSTFGSSPNTDACPADAGSYHAGGSTGSGSGWWGNDEKNLMGCALAIAPKSRASQVRPEDFIVMSIQENCVRQRDTPFAIPSNLPSCPDGECTCAWFWQGRNSAAEMYMIGFRCKVENGVATPFPVPAKPTRGAISGATQPMYWANDNSNLNYNPGWDDRPSYNSKFGWTNGAQTSAFGSTISNPPAEGNTTRSSSSRIKSTTVPVASTDNHWQTSSSAWQDSAASSTSSRHGRQTSSTPTSSASQTQQTAWNQHLAQPDAASVTSSAAGLPSKTSVKPKVCRRGHLKRRSRSHA